MCCWGGLAGCTQCSPNLWSWEQRLHWDHSQLLTRFLHLLLLFPLWNPWAIPQTTSLHFLWPLGLCILGWTKMGLGLGQILECGSKSPNPSPCSPPTFGVKLGFLTVLSPTRMCGDLNHRQQKAEGPSSCWQNSLVAPTNQLWWEQGGKFLLFFRHGWTLPGTAVLEGTLLLAAVILLRSVFGKERAFGKCSFGQSVAQVGLLERQEGINQPQTHVI